MHYCLSQQIQRNLCECVRSQWQLLKRNKINMKNLNNLYKVVLRNLSVPAMIFCPFSLANKQVNVKHSHPHLNIFILENVFFNNPPLFQRNEINLLILLSTF